jgi:phosphonate transport system ATP-binding protein
MNSSTQPATTQSAIAVENLFKSFKGNLALKGVSLTVEAGEMVSLVGASGSGKSTLLRHLNGLHVADQGRVTLYGTMLQENGRLTSRIRLLRSQVGFIFQQFNLVSRLSVLENVLVGHLAHLSTIQSALHLFNRSQKESALAALEQVGILEHAYKRASQLSGGQQQRVAIARCLVQRAKIILADEPIASLDPESARKIMELLTDLNRHHNITVVTSLHQVQMVRCYFERVVALRDGEVRFDGNTIAFDDARLNSIYGAAAEELVLTGHGEVFSTR